MKCLAEFRAQQGLTLQQMADKLGVSVALYNAIEYDQRKPSRNFMERFKRAFPTFDIDIFFDELLYKMNSSEDDGNKKSTA